MKITKQLATFLAEEGALTKFIENHENCFIDIYMPNGTEVIHSIGRCGFYWLDTPEGHRFWLNLYERYENK